MRPTDNDPLTPRRDTIMLTQQGIFMERKKGTTVQQQLQYDVHYILDDLDGMRRDIQRLACSLEQIAECLKNNLRS